MGSFDRATAVHRTGEGRYTASLDAAYGFGPALNGGYLMAVLIRAALDSSGRSHPISTAASFLRVAVPGPAGVTVETRKSGRTAEVARVTLTQEGVPIVDALITSGTLDGEAEPRYSGDADALAALEDCVTFDEKDQGFAAQVELRYDPATVGWLDGEPSGRAEMRAYFRLRDQAQSDARSQPQDDGSMVRAPEGALLALAVDSMPPVALNTGVQGWSPTVDLTWHMRAVPVAGWLALHGRGRLVSDGWFDEEVEVWDSAGRLVAQSRQIARAGRKSR